MYIVWLVKYEQYNKPERWDANPAAAVAWQRIGNASGHQLIPYEDAVGIAQGFNEKELLNSIGLWAIVLHESDPQPTQGQSVAVESFCSAN